jgi:hypothetical protein
LNITAHIGRVAASFAVALVGLAAPEASFAQNITTGLGLVVSVPQGEFGEKLDDAGIGLGASVAYRIPSTPIHFGIEGNIMTYGAETRREAFSPNIPDVTVEVETSNNIATGNLFLRIQPEMEIVSPYIDGFAGFNYLFTSTSVQNINGVDENIATSTNVDDAAFAYGAGAGVMIRLFHQDDPEVNAEGNSGIRDGYLDLRVRYSRGGEASYLTSGSIVRESGTVRYDLTESRTDMLTAMIGFTARF